VHHVTLASIDNWHRQREREKKKKKKKQAKVTIHFSCFKRDLFTWHEHRGVSGVRDPHCARTIPHLSFREECVVFRQLTRGEDLDLLIDASAAAKLSTLS